MYIPFNWLVNSSFIDKSDKNTENFYILNDLTQHIKTPYIQLRVCVEGSEEGDP